MERLAEAMRSGYLRGARADGSEAFLSVPAQPWQTSSTSPRMPTFMVEGGHRLSGRIRPAGNKNAALPCLAATVLADEPVTLENVPRIRDVETFLDIVVSLGAKVTWDGPNEVTVDPRDVEVDAIDRNAAERIRASLLLAGPRP